MWGLRQCPGPARAERGNDDEDGGADHYRSVDRMAPEAYAGSEGDWRYLRSLSPLPGWVSLKGDLGVTDMRGGSLSIAGPHGGPELRIWAIPGTVFSYPYDRSDGRVSQSKGVRDAGFGMVFTTAPLPDMPLHPRIRLEFRDDTQTIRTRMAKVENAEWGESQTGMLTPRVLSVPAGCSPAPAGPPAPAREP